jgi:outer membrane protein assembly factor BamB
MASGRVAWQRRLGDYAPSANLAASPILFEDLVIVAAEGVSDPFVAGAYRDTGDIAWRTRLRLEGESHTTPSVVPTQRGPELVLPTCWSIVGLDPRSGAARWSCPWGQQDSAASIALSATRIFAMGNSPIQEVLAVDISSPDEPHVLWRKTQGAGKVPSLLLAGQDLILVGDDGVAACLNPETGATVWRKRLGGQFSASPVLAGENVFAVNEDGKIFVFRTGREYQRVGTLDLGEPVFASPAICEGRLFVRSIRSLFCVASPTN